MSSATAAIFAATIVAVLAITSATIAVINHSLDGASFAAILGAAIGAAGNASAHAVALRHNGNNNKPSPEVAK